MKLSPYYFTYKYRKHETSFNKFKMLKARFNLVLARYLTIRLRKPIETMFSTTKDIFQHIKGRPVSQHRKRFTSLNSPACCL